MPDISLLIPLSEALHVSLANLLSGESDVPTGDELLNETVQMSANQTGRQNHRFSRLILNLVAAGLVALFLAPWIIDHLWS